MKAVVLAAGEGARMGPFTVSEPKVMIPVGNKPILEHTVEALVENGVSDLLVVVGYRRERIQSYFEDGRRWNARITYVRQAKQLGTLHALMETRDHVEGRFLVVNGSNLVDAKAIADLTGVSDPHAMLVTESETPEKYGVVSLNGQFVETITEKPRQPESSLINTGIYAFDGSAFSVAEGLLRGGQYNIPTLVQALAVKSRVRAVRTEGSWHNALYPWDLLRLNAHALRQVSAIQSGTIERDVTLRGPVAVGEGSRIRSGTYVLGPVVIGRGCEIGPNVVVYPSTSIGNNAKILPFTVIENSVIMDDTLLGPSSTVSHSVLGPGVRASSNLMASRGRAEAQVEGEWHVVDPLGALVGEDTEIRDGVVIEPGSIVGAGCSVASMSRIRGNVPNRTNVM